MKTSLENMKFKKVVGSKGNQIGTIRDAVINKETLALRGFVVYGSALEELLERVGARADVDPLILPDVIEHVGDDEVKLNKNKDELPNAMGSGEIKSDEMLFSDLRKIPVLAENGERMGLICDIYFDDSGKHSYTLGGTEFLNFLRNHNLTPAVEYTLPSNKLAKVDNGYKITQSLKDIEKEIKLNITNIVRDILVEAERDGKVTSEEKALIDSLKVDLPVYMEALAKAKEDNVITKEEERELEKIKDSIIHKVVLIARSDNQVTEDERALIKKLAAYMVDKRDVLFWRIFGTA